MDLDTHTKISWNVIDKMLSNSNVLVEHHISSYNNFFSSSIKQIFNDNNPVNIYKKYNNELTDYDLKCELFFGGKDGSKLYIGKPILYENEYTHLLYPNEARLKNKTYGFNIYYDIDIEFIIRKTDNTIQNISITLEQINLGKFPIMLHSNFCLLNNLPYNSKYFMGECINDKGGYFIIDGKSYGVVESGVNFLDLKNDNILDMIGFFYDTRFNFSPGYFFVMIDVFGEKEVQIFNTESWVVPRYEINDLNGDGYLDVMTFTSNSHPDPDGNEGSENLPVKLYFFDSNGNFTEEYTGPSLSHHDGASGDIDNDGDVDIFVHGTQDIWGPNVIGLYINDGLGSFTFNTDLINNGEPPSVFINTMQSLSHRLVDIDGDNCLDIIMGAHFNDDLISSANTYPPYIHWGDCSGEFTFDTINSNNTSVLPNETVNDLDQTYDFIVLGQNFFDIDNDGDLDIVVSLTTSDQDNFYQYYYLQILINNGDRTFTDRTEIIDHNFGDGPFYRTRIHDIDNDGDFEIIPYQRDAVNIPNLGFYWENRGGTFIRIDY